MEEKPRNTVDLPKAHIVFKGKPYVRPYPKLGRNELCYCGSGLKYKHCHLELDKLSENGERMY